MRVTGWTKLCAQYGIAHNYNIIILYMTKKNKKNNKKQTKKYNPNNKKKIRAGGIVSGIINIDDLINKSKILKPFITNDALNTIYIDNFIKGRIEAIIDNLRVSDKPEISLGDKLQGLISDHIELALKSDKINGAINGFIDDKFKRLSYDGK